MTIRATTPARRSARAKRNVDNILVTKFDHSHHSDGKQHRGAEALPSSVEDGPPRSNLNRMNIGFGLEARDDGYWVPPPNAM